MKRKLLVTSALLIGIAGVMGGVILSQNKSVALRPVSSVTQTKVTDTQPAPTPAATLDTTTQTPVAAPQPVTTTPTVPTPADTKNEVEQMVQQFALSKGADLNVAQDNIDYQFRCLDRAIVNAGVGYDNHDATISFVKKFYIDGQLTPSGKMERHFFGPNCSLMAVPIN